MSAGGSLVQVQPQAYPARCVVGLSWHKQEEATGSFQLHYNLMGPPSYIQSLLDLAVIVWHMTVIPNVRMRSSQL